MRHVGSCPAKFVHGVIVVVIAEEGRRVDDVGDPPVVVYPSAGNSRDAARVHSSSSDQVCQCVARAEVCCGGRVISSGAATSPAFLSPPPFRRLAL